MLWIKKDSNEYIRNEFDKEQTNFTMNTPAILTSMQIIVTTIVIAIAGVLGLVRLNSVEKDNQIFRDNTYKNVEERIAIKYKELESILKSSINSKVLEKVDNYKNDINSYKKEVYSSLESDIKKIIDSNRNEFELQTKELKENANNLLTIISKFKWLTSKEKFSKMTIDSTNVEMVHDQATSLREEGYIDQSHELIKHAVEKGLYGDPDSFHNLYIETKDTGDFELSLKVLDRGLQFYPSNSDLIARKSELLARMGNYLEAEKIVREMLQKDPDSFFSSTRPIQALITIYKIIGMSPERLKIIKDSFDSYLDKDKYEGRIWGAYFQFLRQYDSISNLEQIVDKALKYVPHTSYVNYFKAELLIRIGDKSCINYIKKALRYQYDENYHIYAAEGAYELKLAQAYEINDQHVLALPIYQWIVNSAKNVTPTKKKYAETRIRAIELFQTMNSEQ